MDYKLTATVNRHFLVVIYRHWLIEFIRPFRGTLVARIYQATQPITKWTGISRKHLTGKYKGKGKV